MYCSRTISSIKNRKRKKFNYHVRTLHKIIQKHDSEIIILTMNWVISVSLRTIVLQTDSPTKRIDNPMFRVGSPTKPVLAVFLVPQTVGPTHQQDYRYVGQDQHIVSPTFCRTIDALVKTSVTLVLLSVGILTRWSKPVYFKSYFMQYYRYSDHKSYFLQDYRYTN